MGSLGTSVVSRIPGVEYAVGVPEALSAEQVPARLAEIRGQLKLLADYL